MAKTRKPRKSAPKQKPITAAVPATPGAWTVDEAIQAINATSVEEDIAILKRAGILTEKGKLAKLYTSWGDRVSRTPTLSEMQERK